MAVSRLAVPKRENRQLVQRSSACMSDLLAGNIHGVTPGEGSWTIHERGAVHEFGVIAGESSR